MRRSIDSMTTHPDVLFEIVRDHQARLRKEAEHQNQVTELRRTSDSRGERSGRHAGVARQPLRRWFSRTTVAAPAGTLAACAPAASE